MTTLTQPYFAWPGTIPDWLGQLPHLHTLDLSSNRLTGRIPESIAGCTWLHSLCVFGNTLTGPIPASIGRLTNLRSLELNENSLTGNSRTAQQCRRFRRLIADRVHTHTLLCCCV